MNNNRKQQYNNDDNDNQTAAATKVHTPTVQSAAAWSASLGSWLLAAAGCIYLALDAFPLPNPFDLHVAVANSWNPSPISEIGSPCSLWQSGLSKIDIFKKSVGLIGNSCFFVDVCTIASAGKLICALFS